jgi:hypothetical protein
MREEAKYRKPKTDDFTVEEENKQVSFELDI